MTDTPWFSPAIERLLENVLNTAYDKHLPTITLEYLLAALLEQPGMAAFWHAGPGREKLAALRAELSGMLQRDAALQTARRNTLSCRLDRMLKSLSRIGLSRAAVSRLQWREGCPQFDKEVEHVLAHASPRGAPPKSVELTDVLLSILDNSTGLANEILGRHGVSRYALVCHLTRCAHPLPVAATAGLPADTAVHLFLLNDDFTPMDFVVDVLQTVFAKSPTEAETLMQEVHGKGRACCGSFPLPVAKDKLRQVADLAAGQQHPLRAFLQPSDQDDDALMA